MSEGPQTVISYPLYRKVQYALTKFRDFLPPGTLSFPDHPADKSVAEREKAWIEEWAAALIGVSLDAIPDAASRWLRDEELLDAKGRTRIPQIASFAAYARRVDREHWRPHTPVAAPATSTLPGHMQDFGRRALRELGSWAAAGRVAEVLMASASTREDRERVRQWRITDAEFMHAVDTVRAQIREEARSTMLSAVTTGTREAVG